jgi:hypothetical protein
MRLSHRWIDGRSSTIDPSGASIRRPVSS